jgi:hypothetical protein
MGFEDAGGELAATLIRSASIRLTTFGSVRSGRSIGLPAWFLPDQVL